MYNHYSEFSQAIPLTDLEPSILLSQDKELTDLPKNTLPFLPKPPPILTTSVLKTTKFKVISSNKIETILRSTQYYINDLVLKGTCSIIKMNTPLNDLTSNHFNLFINFFDIALGIPNLIQKTQILEKSQETLNELKNHRKNLSPIQLKRLNQLEKIVAYQKSLIPNLFAEQGLRISRSLLTNVKIGAELVLKKSFAQKLIVPLDYLIGAITTLISGLFFQQACDHLNLQNLWIKENPEIFVPPPEVKSLVQLKERRQKRAEEQQYAKEQLINQLQTNERSRKQIEIKISEAEIKKLIKKDEFSQLFSFSSIKQNLEHLLQTEFPLPSLMIPCSVDRAYEELEKIEQDSSSITDEKKKETINKILNKHLKAWLSYRSEEELVELYFKNYEETQETINPIIKGTLVEFVKKKHEIEREFLNFKTTQYGISFALSLIMLVVSNFLLFFTLLPAAALFMLLATTSIGSSLLCFVAENRIFYQQKPNLTTASFKGSSIKLIFYHAMHFLVSTKQLIVNHFTKPPLPTVESQSWLEKATQLQEMLDQAAWEDFSQEAHSNTSSIWEMRIDRLDEALREYEFDLLSTETKEILEKQLGFNLSTLKEELKKDPFIIKKTLKKFCILDTTAFIEFMGKKRGGLL